MQGGGARSWLKRSLERLLGARILRPPLPRGLDLLADLAAQFPDHRFETVFDVGANDGRRARGFATAFAHAQVHAFEPSAETCAQLAAMAAGTRITAHRLALGASETTGWISAGGPSALRRVSAAPPTPGAAAERVEVTTVDAFCAARGVERISFLKIDAEGADLEVIDGAAAMIDAGRIDMIEIEVGLNPDNDLHAPLPAVCDALWPRGFWLFALYDQAHAWPSDRRHLRRANAVFIADALS